MANPIPERPVLLVDYLKNLLEGDDQFRTSEPLPTRLRALLEATHGSLAASNLRVLHALAEYGQAVQERRDLVEQATRVARKVRNVVYGLHGRTDAALSAYGLATPVEPRPEKKDQDEPPAPAEDAA